MAGSTFCLRLATRAGLGHRLVSAVAAWVALPASVLGDERSAAGCAGIRHGPSVRFESHPLRQRAGAHLVGGTCLIRRLWSGSIPTRRTPDLARVAQRKSVCLTSRRPEVRHLPRVRIASMVAVAQRSARRVVVPELRGFESRLPPQGSVGQPVGPAGCKPVARSRLAGSSPVAPTHVLVAQRKRIRLRSGRLEVRILPGALYESTTNALYFSSRIRLTYQPATASIGTM